MQHYDSRSSNKNKQGASGEDSSQASGIVSSTGSFNKIPIKGMKKRMKWIGSRVKYDKYDQNTESEADEFA